MKKAILTEETKNKIRARRAKILAQIDRAVWFYELPNYKKKIVREIRAKLLDAPQTGIFPDIPDWITK